MDTGDVTIMSYEEQVESAINAALDALVVAQDLWESKEPLEQVTVWLDDAQKEAADAVNWLNAINRRDGRRGLVDAE